MPPSEKRPRGFAAMDPQKQRAISSRGGRAAHQSGNAHEFTSDEARAAGALSHARRREQGQRPASSGADGTLERQERTQGH
ncbi:Stress-induced bacterial acidophilic repeat motif protein [Pigmentiphaga humi]|uniref:Stress-induced bacterial acidophilic repeat motif protein n=1 Tax=Pigmentiphaga humi TaxID=2478468 RepID=A0A3P4B612_9BURK|nr:KGG domain-containing protein [Pigmentiphaga humi]VCU71351.1 Stress-induced bacterial acidophilic repeat motif protein [Pigmentiphaga humi]